MTVPPQNTWQCKYIFSRGSTGKKFVNRPACIDWLNTLRCVCKTAEFCPSGCTYIRGETVGGKVQPIFNNLQNVKQLWILPAHFKQYLCRTINTLLSEELSAFVQPKRNSAKVVIIIIIMSVIELGHLLTYLEASSAVCHGSFCQLGNRVSLLWAVCHVVSSSTFILLVCIELVFFLISLQFVNLFCIVSKCILLFSYISSLLLLFSRRPLL